MPVVYTREDLDDGFAAVHGDHLEKRVAVAEVEALLLAGEQTGAARPWRATTEPSGRRISTQSGFVAPS